MNNLKVLTGVAAIAATMAAPLAAAEQSIDSRWYVAPMARYVIADDERQLQNEEGYGLELNFGRQVSDLVNFELNLFGDRIEQGTTDTEADQFGAGVNFLVIPKRTGFAPYALLGGGALWTQGDAINGTREGHPNPYGEIGVGAFIPVTANGTSIRLEAKHRATRNNDLIVDEHTFQDTIVSLGLQIPFGAKAVAAAAPIVAVVPVAPRDSDNDGVVDSRDLCPNTPVGTLVNANGCPRDSDNDGIIDERDLCPNTAAGIRVDSTGCEIKDVITLKGVNFELNSAKLMPASADRLDGAVATLKRYTDTNVLIAGHTDSTGDASYNLDLSKRRAKSVEAYLIRNGVNPGQLTTQGFGESQPVASNRTRAGRAQNRRVELRIQK